MQRGWPNARLPEILEADLEIEALDPLVEIGQGGWAGSHWVCVDTERRLWLYTHLQLAPSPSPLEEMYVFREEEGYIIDIRNCPDAKWQSGPITSETYARTKGNQSDCAPIIKVIR